MRQCLLALAFVLPLLSGCARLFGPGFSCHDPDYFAEPPIIVHYDDHYALRWRYGTLGYYFEPQYTIRDGVLVFSLQSIGSTGDLADKISEIPIKRYEEIMAIKRGGAQWWSASDGVTTLEVVEEHAAEPVVQPDDPPPPDTPVPADPNSTPDAQNPAPDDKTPPDSHEK